MSTEYAYANNLNATRKGHRLKTPVSMSKEAKQELSLFKYVRIEDFIFVGFAVTIALLKDILDFVGIGSLPAIGTVVTVVVSIFIAASMYIVGANKKMRKKARAQANSSKFVMKRLGTLFGGTIAEFIFGLDFLPIETLMTLFLYRLILLERKEESGAK
ncbi:MAG: hypothetical protein WCX17_04350 [Parcubacteria group bacterium]|jgi:hypothetical protein